MTVKAGRNRTKDKGIVSLEIIPTDDPSLLCDQQEDDEKSVEIEITPTGDLALLEDSRLLKMEQLIELIGVTPRTIHQWVTDGTFPKPIKLGRLSRWHESEVAEWVAQRGKGVHK